MSQNFLFGVFLKGPFVYGEVRTGRVVVTAGSLQWKYCYCFLADLLSLLVKVVISVKGGSAREVNIHVVS